MAWNWKSAFDPKVKGPTKERLAIAAAGLALAGLPLAGFSEGSQISAVASAGPIQSAGAASVAKMPTRPLLTVERSRAYEYSIPRGWRVHETSNGIELIDPDGVTGVSGSILVGGFGAPSPEQYLRQVLSMSGHSNARFISSLPVPPQPGPMGLQWRGVEVELESQYQGAAVHIRAISLILQGAGQYAAIVTGAQGPVGKWNQLKHWLPRVRDSIRIVDGSIATGSMSNALPRGIRHDEIYGSYNRAWSARQVSADAISKAQREGTMGYKRMIDPETSQIYEPPLEAYDPTRGGWRNPVRPDELLVETNN